MTSLLSLFASSFKPLSDTLSYVTMFGILYFQIFLLVTFIGKRQTIREEEMDQTLSQSRNDTYPTATVIVPCFNEEKTVDGTIKSLLSLNYPADKLKILIINDGSKDNTGAVIDKFVGHPQIEVYHKENGGKYTALNFALSKTTSEIVGCLDADSFADREALSRIANYFKNPEVMAVTPSVVISHSSNIIRQIQKAEYNLGIFVRKVCGMLDAINVTPGPFSFFRLAVFKKIGNYRHAHNTEDLEIAFRMQKHHMKIVNAHKAFVFTVGPNTIKKLYRQRVRWTSGFLSNLVDYRDMVFKKKYGHLGMIVLPMTIFGVISTLVLIGLGLIHFGISIHDQIVRYQAIGAYFKMPTFASLSFDWFFVNTSALLVIGVGLWLLTVAIIMYGQKIATGKTRLGIDTFYFLFFYSFIAPFWLIKSVYNTTLSKTAPWR
ncbi:MAG: glycosyltransferase [Candidatus Pacebacteria bacterium]|nr:glycosyltransferase [Candidatus Paceibacterota bacterium]